MNQEQPTSGGNRYRKTMIPGPLLHLDGTLSSDGAKPAGVALTLPQKVSRYVLIELLATGGMSLTYLGYREDAPTRQVVVKIPLADDPNTHERFREEIHLLKDLNHHGIVKVLAGGQKDFTFDGDQPPRLKPWFAMEFIPGQSLRQRLTREGRLSWTQVKRLLRDVLETLQYLHERHICHRDVKPDNLIYDDEHRRWMLVDFGIAKSLLSDKNLTLTATRHDPGSWEYMSPEQQSGQKVDSRSDIYSLGKTIWEALIGEVPRVGTPYPGEMPDVQVPAEVDALLRKMVAHIPEKRFQTPREVHEVLEVEGDGREQRLQRRQQRRRLLRRAAMILLPLLLLAVGWFIGDFVCAQQAADLYLEHRGSPTITVRKLEQFANNHWFWGRQYTDAKLAELRPLAEQEHQDMIGEHQKLLQEIAQPKHKGQYYLIRCRNFVKSYGELFGETPEFLAIRAEQERFEVSEKINREISLAEDVIAESQRLEKEARFKHAIELCQSAQNKFVLKEAKLLLEKRERQLRDVYYVSQLKKIDDKLKPGDANSLLQAAVEVQALEGAFGSSRETTRRLTEYDAQFWDLCAKGASKAIQQHQYENARAQVQFYLDNTRRKDHTLQASALHKSIADGEDDHDWDRMKQSIDKNLSQNTHALACEDAAKYLNKYPRGTPCRPGQKLTAENHCVSRRLHRLPKRYRCLHRADARFPGQASHGERSRGSAENQDEQFAARNDSQRHGGRQSDGRRQTRSAEESRSVLSLVPQGAGTVFHRSDSACEKISRRFSAVLQGALPSCLAASSLACSGKARCADDFPGQNALGRGRSPTDSTGA